MKCFSTHSVLCVLACAMLASCGHHADENVGPRAMIYSPNGEPLNGGALGRPICRLAMEQWFMRVAKAPDGVLTLEAFLADAKEQFRQMDIDHNGDLTAEELERYRAPYRQDQLPERRQNKDNHDPRGRKPDEERPHEKQTAQVDPVMSADANLDFRVSHDEFMAQAQAVFAAHADKEHHILLRDAAESFCPTRP